MSRWKVSWFIVTSVYFFTPNFFKSLKQYIKLSVCFTISNSKFEQNTLYRLSFFYFFILFLSISGIIVMLPNLSVRYRLGRAGPTGIMPCSGKSWPHSQLFLIPVTCFSFLWGNQKKAITGIGQWVRALDSPSPGGEPLSGQNYSYRLIIHLSREIALWQLYIKPAPIPTVN